MKNLLLKMVLIYNLLFNLIQLESYNIKNPLIPPKNTYSIKKYISNNKVSPFILFTVVNNCCKCIMIYHNIVNEYHGNTTIDNFYMYDNYECILLNTKKDNINYTLNRSQKYKDYSIFFDSFVKDLCIKNLYFLSMYNRYRISIFESIFLFNNMNN